MNYTETLNWMLQKLPMYQKKGKSAFKKGLGNIKKLSAHLQYPETTFKSIHVAGTNGKGSVSHILASVFQEAGYKTGLYTSPHLKDFRERIKIDGKVVSEQFVVRFIKDNQSFINQQQLSFFEMTVGMTFSCFAQNNVDIAIVETGLGGRLDATNIITPEISVITNIGYDHTQFLGDTLAEIAFEKAGIIKDNVPVVLGERHEDTLAVFKKIATQRNAALFITPDTDTRYETDLKGDYQQRNIATALQAIRVLNEGDYSIDESAMRKGLSKVITNTGLQGRWQLLGERPAIICDTAHNKEGLTYVLKQLRKQHYKNLHILIGLVKDKKTDEILPLFPKDALYYFCQPDMERAMDASYLKEKAAYYGLKGTVYPSVADAFRKAKRNSEPEDLIFVGGSTFVVAEIL